MLSKQNVFVTIFSQDRNVYFVVKRKVNTQKYGIVELAFFENFSHKGFASFYFALCSNFARQCDKLNSEDK